MTMSIVKCGFRMDETERTDYNKLSVNFAWIIIDEAAGRRACDSGEPFLEPAEKLDTNAPIGCVYEIWHRTESILDSKTNDWMHLVWEHHQNLQEFLEQRS